MITWFEAVILGLIQGIAEWLPISSSGHLVLAEKIMGISQPLAFDVYLHLASLLVILIIFWQDISRLAIGVFRGDKYFIKYFSWLILASIPIGLVGYFLRDLIETAFNSLFMVGLSLLFTGLVLYFSKYPLQKNKRLSWSSSFFAGIAQAIALLPGVSRSGMTISSALMQSVERKEAVRFSFLLFIPAVLGATFLEASHLAEIESFSSLAIAMVVSFVFGYFSLKWLLKIVQEKHFYHFCWYCWGLGLVILIVSLV